MCRILAQSGPGWQNCHFVSPTVILSVGLPFCQSVAGGGAGAGPIWFGLVWSGPVLLVLDLEKLLYIGTGARIVEIWTAKFFYFYKYLIFNKLQEKCKFF